MAAFMAVLATASVPPTIAQEPTERKRDRTVALDRLRPCDAPPVVAETMIDAAIRAMLCLEVRAAINRGQLDRPGRQWVLTHGHRCRDDRLLSDAFGF